MRSNPTLSVATNLKLAYALFLAPLVFLFYVMVSQAVSIDDLARKEIVGGQFIIALQKVEIDLALPGATVSSQTAAALKDAENRFGARLGMSPDSEQAYRAISEAKTAASARGEVHKLIVVVADKSGLTIDPELNSFYVQDIVAMRVPDVVDRLSTLAERVSRSGGESELTVAEQSETLLQLGGLESAILALERSASSIGRDAAETGSANDLSGVVKESVDTLTIVANGLRHRATYPANRNPADATPLVTTALASLEKLSDRSASALDNMLKDRIGRTLAALWSNIAIAASLFLAGVAFILFRVELGAVRPLRQLADNLTRLANGDASGSIEGTARDDEIGNLARAAQAFRNTLTRERELEAELLRSHEGLIHAQQLGKIGSADVDLRTGKASWSEGMFQIYGLQPGGEPTNYEDYLALVHPDDLETERTHRNLIERGGPVPPLEYRIRRPGGEVRWIYIETDLRFDANGVPISLFTIHQDITDRRHLEEDLLRSHDMLVNAQLIGRVGSSEVDLRTDTSLWSEEMLRIYGIDESSSPRSFDEFLAHIHPDDRDAYRAIRARDLSEENLEPVEYRIIRPDGVTRWVRDHRGVVRDRSGTPIKLIGMQQDITDQRRDDEELRRSREKMAEVLAALDIARNAVILLDDKFGITYANEAAFDFLGLPTGMESLIGKRLIDMQADNPPFLDLVAKTRALVELNGEWQGTVPWRRPIDGRNLILDHRVHRLPNGGHVLVSTDATERVHLEEEDRRHREQEAQAGKIEALGNLAGGIAHDFNNLLGAVQGFGRFLMEDLKPGTDQHKFAERIVAASERGRSMVRQILAFSRRTAIEVSDVRLRDAIAEAYDMLRATLPSTTQIVLENAVPRATIFIDKGQLLQVLVNLCVNASDALNEKPGTVTVSVSFADRSRPDLLRLPAADGRPDLVAVESWIDADGVGHILTGGMPKGDSVCLSVSDSGSGIPQGMLEKVLEPFVTTKENGKGTGLGLAVIHRIVVDSGGAMAVSTREGLGTRFDIILPLSSGETGKRSVDQLVSVERVKIAPEDTANVLVVDDDEAYLAMVETALRRIGHHVQSTNDPRVALEWIKRDTVKWEILVTDQTMPHIRGNDLIEQVKALKPHTACILCTGFSSDLSERQAAAAGPDAFLFKPYSIGDLVNLIGRLRGEKRHSVDGRDVRT